MSEKVKPEKSDFRYEYNKFGVNIPVPTIRLSDKHPCCGCVWYDRDTDVLFCPFHSCVRYKNGFIIPKKGERKC